MQYRTNLYDRLHQYESKFIDFNGWDMPISFSGTLKEHDMVRNNSGFFDVSHMGRFLIDKDDIDVLSTLICGDIVNKNLGTALYTMILNEEGGIIDDIIIWKFEQKLILICNASNMEKVKDWFDQNKLKHKYLNEGTSLVAIQGPKVIKKLEKYIDIPNHFECKQNKAEFLNKEFMIARTGYTGEDGIEIMLEDGDDASLIDLLDKLSILPCGLGSRDTLRLEASLPLYGQELTESVTPIEVGFKWIVDFSHNFIGKEILKEQINSKEHKFLKKFIIDERIVARSGDKAYSGQINGVVTSGNYSPKLKKSIGFVLFDSNPKTNSIKINIRDKFINGQIIKGKFIGA